MLRPSQLIDAVATALVDLACSRLASMSLVFPIMPSTTRAVRNSKGSFVGVGIAAIGLFDKPGSALRFAEAVSQEIDFSFDMFCNRHTTLFDIDDEEDVDGLQIASE